MMERILYGRSELKLEGLFDISDPNNPPEAVPNEALNGSSLFLVSAEQTPLTLMRSGILELSLDSRRCVIHKSEAQDRPADLLSRIETKG